MDHRVAEMSELRQGGKGVLEAEWKKINIHSGKEWQECILLFLLIGFSQLSAAEFFVFRKTETCETENHLLCGWSDCQKRSAKAGFF